MELASSNPSLEVGKDYPTLDRFQKVEYMMYVERMLFAGEQVLTFDPEDTEWRLSIQMEARRHSSYLRSHDFLSESLCGFTRNLRRTLIQAFDNSDRQLAARLTTRDKQCTAEGYDE